MRHNTGMVAARSIAGLVGAGSALLIMACTALPPRWAEGGAPIEMTRARWDGPLGPVDLLEDGRVLINGEQVYLIDRVGRVADDEKEPVAVLQPNGVLAGTTRHTLGYLGDMSASPPGEQLAWLTIAPNGEVLRYDSDGNKFPSGVWTGCEGTKMRTCLLVTHLLALREEARKPRVGVGVGIGFTTVIR